MFKLIQNYIKVKSNGGKITQLLQKRKNTETAFPGNLPKASQNKKKFSFEIHTLLSKSSNVPIDDDIQSQTTCSTHTYKEDPVDLSPTAELQ